MTMIADTLYSMLAKNYVVLRTVMHLKSIGILLRAKAK